MLSNRKRLILKAVVENYSKEAKPISSELLSKISYLNFSSATIRYDMMQLEKKGYLEKNHKSSGRIPSLKGYVFYLNNLMTREQKKTLQIISLFEDILEKNSFNKERIIKDVLKLLCNLTNYVTMSIKPNFFKTSKIIKISLILVNPEQAVIFLITDKGNVQNQNIFLKQYKDFTFQDLYKIVLIFNNFLVNKYLFQALEIVNSNYFKEKIMFFYKKPNQEKLIQSLIDTFYNFFTNDFQIYGLHNFFNYSKNEDIKTIKDIIQMLDNKEFNKVFFDSKGVLCRLANQISLIPYRKFIIVSIPYDINENEKGIIAILGPIIMEYQEIIPILEYLSAHLSNLYMI
ncbi:heat-inducible transcriptional repressor HrcA [Candidatus Phytoplasma palmae]|uniref:heat-inducible transcriptional repressor HrcA n=1 Tax=Candidatus Phytoplasma palmae TaxID=85624 RepID=UPI003990503E